MRVADLMYATQAGAQHRGLLRDLLILRTEDSQRWQATIPLPSHSCGLIRRTNEGGAREIEARFDSQRRTYQRTFKRILSAVYSTLTGLTVRPLNLFPF